MNKAEAIRKEFDRLGWDVKSCVIRDVLKDEGIIVTPSQVTNVRATGTVKTLILKPGIRIKVYYGPSYDSRSPCAGAW